VHYGNKVSRGIKLLSHSQQEHSLTECILLPRPYIGKSSRLRPSSCTVLHFVALRELDVYKLREFKSENSLSRNVDSFKNSHEGIRTNGWVTKFNRIFLRGGSICGKNLVKFHRVVFAWSC